MTRTMGAREWLARLRHDLVKRLLWPARDLRDSGAAPRPGELMVPLVDEEGRPATAASLWAAMAAEAPPGLDTADFAAALERALEAARAGDVAGVLALEAAFDRLAALARSLEGQEGG